MQRISAVVDGQLQAVPVLTPKHLSAISKIRSGVSPGCAPDILQDLIQAGLVKDLSAIPEESSPHGTSPMA